MKKLLSFIAVVALIFMSSCRPSGAFVKVRPEAPVYVHPASPSAGYVWVDGDWVWQRNRYVYRQGYYIKSRPHHSAYVAGHWQRRGHGWIWIPGRWR